MAKRNYKKKSLYFSNRKEFIRRKKISVSLKRRFKNKRLLKSQFPVKNVVSRRQIKKKVVEPKPEYERFVVPKERIRKQVSADYYNPDLREIPDDYIFTFLNIKVITINPEIDERGLILALEDARKLFVQETGMNLNNHDYDYKGFENTRIASMEDRKLNDGKIHITFFYGGKERKHIIYSQ